jgi:dTDP-glucose pyrophosphorylase
MNIISKKVERLIIDINMSIINALKLMDKQRCKLLIILENSSYLGLVSIGDIQRAIIGNKSISASVASIMRNDYIVAKKTDSITEIRKVMLRIRAEFMPVVDDDNNLVEVHFWEDLFGEALAEPLFKFSLPVVIMAGGRGTRLKPLTNVLPKPLIPIDDKSLIESILESFHKHGCSNFFISVNYKAELIEYYLLNLHLPYHLIFFKEEKPMGTAGSLSLLNGKISDTFFVSNCDILIDQDYSEVLNYHRENTNEITIVAAMKHFPIAYGTIETGENGQLINLSEKPELTFKINSGMYILEPHLLNEIPEGQYFHITDLIGKIKERGGRIGVFPVSEKSWSDIGNWNDYLRLISQMASPEK